MKIAVNTRLLLPGRLEGIGRFAHEVLSRLAMQMADHEFHFLFDRAFDPSFIYAPNVIGHSVFPPARHPILYNWWFHRSLPRVMRRIGADILFSPEGYLPLTRERPMINVIHDINFEHHPDLLDAAHSKHFRTYFPRYAEIADDIITVSEFSRSDLIKTYNLEANKIHIAYNGVSDEFAPLEDEHKSKVRSDWTGGAPYFVYIGSIHPRKNLIRLLEAFDRFKDQVDLPHRLLIIGQKAFKNEELEKTYEGLKSKDDVHFMGRLEQKDMIKLLASADALTYIPLFEGFGIPVVEAFKCGTPVITSDITALPEVAGDAAILVDPLDTDSVTKAMLKISSDKLFRDELSLKGQTRAKQFSWDLTASVISSILEKHLD